jgi:Uri superfamily endonuclease
MHKRSSRPEERRFSLLKGIYVLLIRVDKSVTVSVGALGSVAFRKGTYAYVGSAQRNLEQRVQRHLRRKKRRFWHIDYLLGDGAAKIRKILYKEGGKAEECRVASEISQRAEAVSGFGCSDCRCRSHLFRVADFKFLTEFLQVFNISRVNLEKSFKKVKHSFCKGG